MVSPVVVSRIQNRRGTQVQFDALYPPGYNGVGGADINIWTNILLPGEVALCTDTRRVFIGNLNGEYIEIDTTLGGGIALLPLVISLPPIGVFTAIPELEYDPSPFFTLLYDVTDSPSLDWNVVGSNFSKNGELKITAVADWSPPTPAATLTDTGTEMYGPGYTTESISFEAGYNLASDKIQIRYTHNFPTNLTFSTTSLRWLPF